MKNDKKIRLSYNQKEVILKLRGGSILFERFGYSMRAKNTIQLDNVKIGMHAFNSLKKNGIIIFDRIEGGGMTKHHYKLTELGKTIEL